ncbi:MAG TPA: hypothetical protein GX007_08265 [Bacteroidales bacterium]|jgi:hypothetical protein|nr:hypothetical protein [Bacteroidales bacterium]
MANFDEKIQEQFKAFAIKTPNSAKYKNQYYADYIELVSLVTSDFVSQSDIVDRLFDEGAVVEIESPRDGEIGLLESQINDKAEGYVNVYFEYLKKRKLIYGDNYPFTFDNKKGIKAMAKSELSEQHKLYIYLLIASSLNSFRKLQQFITDDFEKLSEMALRAYLPENAKVFGFGSHSKYTGNAKDKIRELGNDINVYEFDDRVINLIPNSNTKENGLDVVGWIPFEDNNPNTIIIFGQCACGKDWFGKQVETKRYDKFYRHYLTPFIHAMFYPEDFDNSNGMFNLDLDLIDNIVFERRRLLNLASKNIFEHLTYSKQIVEECLNYQEDIV